MSSVVAEDRDLQTESIMKNLCVVVLDDSEFDRKRMARMIKQANAAVDVVACADLCEFDQALNENLVDLCLIDHQLRNATGIEAVEVVKRNNHHGLVPVVMVSGSEDIEAVVGSMRAGCVDFLGKGNLTAEKLQRVIYDSISESFAGLDLNEEVQKATNTVLTGIAKGCISELQPRLKRVYKQASFIRSCHAQGFLPSPEALDEIEEHCLMIWRFFDEVEQYSESLGETRH